MLRIHFLNVGHGDCTIISHPSGNLTVIDINNGDQLDPLSVEELLPYYSDSNEFRLPQLLKPNLNTFIQEQYRNQLTNPVSFLQKYYPFQSIFRYIQTHPDLDHMRGLSALSNERIGITNFWDTNHNKTPNFQSLSDRIEWNEYKSIRNRRNGSKVLRLYRKNIGFCYNRDSNGNVGGDRIEILSPTPILEKVANDQQNWNNLSYVIRLSYRERRIIFGGDAEADAWKSIINFYGENLKCDVLKASHHGRDSGYYQEAVKLMNPEYTIVSVGKKPSTDASNKYRGYSGNVWSTRWKGNITLSIDNYGKAEIVPEHDR